MLVAGHSVLGPGQAAKLQICTPVFLHMCLFAEEKLIKAIKMIKARPVSSQFLQFNHFKPSTPLLSCSLRGLMQLAPRAPANAADGRA